MACELLSSLFNNVHFLQNILLTESEKEITKINNYYKDEFMYTVDDVVKAVINGSSGALNNSVQELLNQGIDEVILKEGLMRGMGVVGEHMADGTMFIPEVILAAKNMASALELLRPYLSSDSIGASGKIVIGTVQGDVHDIGKNLVITMFEGAGYEVFDLGIDVPPETFVTEVKNSKCDILAMSALLTTTMPKMKETIEAIEKAGLRNDVKIIIGGAPVSRKFSDDIGADGYAPDAGTAVATAKALIDS